MVSPTPRDGWAGPDSEVWRLPPEPGTEVPPPTRRPRQSRQLSSRNRELHVLGWTTGTDEPPTAWEKDPLLTIKSSPKYFAYGIPIVMMAGLVAILLLPTIPIQAATLLWLFAVGIGIAAIYGVAQRRRSDPLTKHLPGSDLRPM